MAKSVNQTEVKKTEFKITNCSSKPVDVVGLDFSDGKAHKYHMVREGNGIEIVDDGIEDRDAKIQSQKCNAGLQNIIRLQTLRYGTLDNAIKRNADRQVFADVSKIPLSVAEQAEAVASSNAEVEALCSKLGISKEDLLKSNVETLKSLLEAKQAAAAASAATGEGGAE